MTCLYHSDVPRPLEQSEVSAGHAEEWSTPSRLHDSEAEAEAAVAEGL